MQPVRPGADSTAAWEIARPSRVSALPGVDMAGFRIGGSSPIELRTIPHPAVTVAIEFGDRPFNFHGAVGRTRAESLAVGLAFNPFQVRAEGVECVQIRLSPLVAHPVLGLPLAELCGGVIALDELWGRDAARLRERLHHARTWPERFALVDSELSARFPAGRTVDPEVSWAWRQIVASQGRTRVSDLAAGVGWSRQRTWSRFGSQIGLTPKRAAMLVRFDRAVHRLVRGHSPARVAADGGYADQSHLHHDVRAFTGETPATAANEPWLAADDRAWPAAGQLEQGNR
ncbi:helix-turn-helix domain-containing protein [Streptomyces alanosinicus]|uniref:AraC family transcriptional regulator n=1 Tax=Streptomyces alanosinicus TaxID=68171 RepID=A0A918YSI5_9ACTN|nr:helix-turn-helix domain-containing protein [Streptomyces alanosinicus]GHE15115.1 AraC family transcriptional regulator [Streptomyces alanosinicus]